MDKSFGYHCIHRYRTTHVESDDFFVETDVMIVPVPVDFWSLSSTRLLLTLPFHHVSCYSCSIQSNIWSTFADLSSTWMCNGLFGLSMKKFSSSTLSCMTGLNKVFDENLRYMRLLRSYPSFSQVLLINFRLETDF